MPLTIAGDKRFAARVSIFHWPKPAARQRIVPMARPAAEATDVQHFKAPFHFSLQRKTVGHRLGEFSLTRTFKKHGAHTAKAEAK